MVPVLALMWCNKSGDGLRRSERQNINLIEPPGQAVIPMPRLFHFRIFALNLGSGENQINSVG